jgi:RHS repeat-associated protein
VPHFSLGAPLLAFFEKGPLDEQVLLGVGSISAAHVHYYFSDHLGTHGVVENATGSACEQDIDYYPYGGVENDYCSTPAAQHYKFTGKERDTESGLDNFGARYNASTMGRFMTPDPLPWVEWQNGSDRAQRRFQAYINNPQNFNMYAYVRNNPTNLTDPTGMYVCKGTKDQCAAIQAGLDKAKEALKGNDLNKQQKAALQKVIGFYGKAGDANGVVVQFGKTGAGTGGNTDSSKVFNANITTITFSPTKFAGLSTLQQAEEEVHEGVHGENGVERGGRNPANKAEELATERNAYRTQSYVPQGLGVADGGWGLWDPTWPAAQAEGDRNSAVDSNAQKSTAAWCAAGGDCQ